MRKRFRHALRAFVDMFREAAAKLKLGNVAAAIFPKGCFRPSLGFVNIGEELGPAARETSRSSPPPQSEPKRRWWAYHRTPEQVRLSTIRTLPKSLTWHVPYRENIDAKTEIRSHGQSKEPRFRTTSWPSGPQAGCLSFR